MTEIILSSNVNVKSEEKLQQNTSDLVDTLATSDLYSSINTPVSVETVEISQIHFHVDDSTDKNIILSTLYSTDINKNIDRSLCDSIRCNNRIIKIALKRL